jgi:mannosyltransferase
MRPATKSLLTNIGFLLIPMVVIVINSFSLFNQSIRLDESQSIWVSTKPVSAILSLTGQDVHVPLYGVLLHFWLQFFGSDVLVARVMSILFLGLSLPALFILANESSTPKIAFLTVVLYAFSPFVAWYSYETRMYTLFLFVTTLNHVFFLRFLKNNGDTGKVPLVMSLVLGLYTHYFFLVVIAVQGLYLLVSGFANQSWHLLVKYTLALLLALAFFSPWIWYMLSLGGASNTQPLIPPPTSYNIFQTFSLFVFGFQDNRIQSLFVSLWPLLVSVLFLAFTQKRQIPIKHSGYFLAATFLPVIIVFLASFVRPIFLARYLIFVTPTLFFLIAGLLMNYSVRTSRIVTGIFLSIMAFLLLFQNVSTQNPVREDYQEVTNYLNNSVSAHDIVVVSAPFTVYPIEYYYKGQAKIDTIPRWNRYQSGAIPGFDADALKSQLEEYRQQYLSMYTVLSYDQGYENEIKNYFDSNLERLDIKSFPGNITVSVYKIRYDVQ